MRRVTQRELRHLERTVDLRVIWGDGKILCPWHDDHIPSLHIYQDHTFCFVCRERHSGVDLATAQGRTFPEAVKFLRQYVGTRFVETACPVDTTPVPLGDVQEWHGNLMEDAHARDYLYQRGIAAVMLMKLAIGWRGERVYSIPHFVNGQVENIKFRIHPDFQMDGERKYDALPNRTFSQLYPYDYFLTYFGDSKVVYVTEGEFDAMVLLQEGLPTVSLCSGVTYKLSKWLDFFRRFEHICLLFDMDDAGSRAAEMVFKKRGKLERSEADILGVPVEVISWDPRWGKDITDAQKKLIPYLQRYVKALL